MISRTSLLYQKYFWSMLASIVSGSILTFGLNMTFKNGINIFSVGQFCYGLYMCLQNVKWFGCVECQPIHRLLFCMCHEVFSV